MQTWFICSRQYKTIEFHKTMVRNKALNLKANKQLILIHYFQTRPCHSCTTNVLSIIMYTTYYPIRFMHMVNGRSRRYTSWLVRSLMPPSPFQFFFLFCTLKRREKRAFVGCLQKHCAICFNEPAGHTVNPWACHMGKNTNVNGICTGITCGNNSKKPPENRQAFHPSI